MGRRLPTAIERQVARIVAARVKHRRLESGLSLMALSQKVNVHHCVLSRYETGHGEITLARLVAIAAALDTPLDYFLKDLTVPVGNDPVPRDLIAAWRELGPYRRSILMTVAHALAENAKRGDIVPDHARSAA